LKITSQFLEVPVFQSVTFLPLSQDEAISSVFLDPAAAQFLLGELKAITVLKTNI
jgi:hypothetical protein